LNFGLVFPGIIIKYDTFHWVMMFPAFIVHFITIVALMRLDYNFMWNIFPKPQKQVRKEEAQCAKKSQADDDDDIEKGSEQNGEEVVEVGTHDSNKDEKRDVMDVDECKATENESEEIGKKVGREGDEIEIEKRDETEGAEIKKEK
jgi:hypothetical protein